MRLLLLIAISTCLLIACSDKKSQMQTPVKVEIVKTDTGFQLMRAGEPYEIKGAGMAINDFELFAAHGGNSVRNWTTYNEHVNTLDFLNAAHANGVTVVLCLAMGAERKGFDYDDEEKVAAQFAGFREEVMKYRNHPALLAWIIGNELNIGLSNPKVYDAVNEVSQMIHELDPNHPTTTSFSGFHEEHINTVLERASDLDFISFQVYGGLFNLRENLVNFGYSAPIMVTEWGALGYWEMEQTSWGAPLELNSTDKADVFLRGHEQKLAALNGQLIGSYAFLWGQKQERSPTWFGMFTEDGEETEAVDVMHYLWNGNWPENRAPQVNSLLLDGKTAKQNVILRAGTTISASFDVSDPDNDNLRYRWEVKPESKTSNVGGDFEEPIPNLVGLLSGPRASTTRIKLPDAGVYRLFAYAYDDHGHAAHANIPFKVE